MKEPAVVGFVGIAEDTVGIETVAQMPDGDLQSPGILLSGHVDEDVLGLGIELLAELACSLDDERNMPVAEVTFREGQLHARKRGHLAPDVDLRFGRVISDAAPPTQPRLAAPPA